MKKSFVSSVLLGLVAMSIFIGCASTPKEPRSIKTNAFKIKKIKTAIEVAENYGLDVLYSSEREVNEKNFSLKIGKFVAKDVLIARNPQNEEAVVFFEFEKDENKSNRMQFVYTYLNIEKTSVVESYLDGIGKVYLKNTEKMCELDSGTHELKADGYGLITKDLAQFRTYCEASVKKRFSIVCDEPINPAQLELIQQ